MTAARTEKAADLSPADRVTLAFRRIATTDRPEVWIHLRDEHEVLAEARTVAERTAAGEGLPLAGATLAVKDNIDVSGLPTTAGCPSFSYQPLHDAPSVARLKAAGALVLGKTNLDQFATGLVGTRSPYGAVPDARDPARVAGGSSSGSAVAVALGIADIALGTDTAGSGRVPAAFQGIIGFKPTRGLVSTRGVVPACRTLDCVSIFARTVAEAESALAVIAARDPEDWTSRTWSHDAPLAAPPNARIATAEPRQLEMLSPSARSAFTAAIGVLRATGAHVVEIDIRPFLQAGALLYGGAFVAERYAAVGSFIAEHPDDIDPTVAEIILGGRSFSASQYIHDLERLGNHRLAAELTFRDFDALLLPTAPRQPSIAEVREDPLELNRELGIYTSFCNLLDLCAVAVPAGEADGRCFGVTLFAPAFHDRVVADLAARMSGNDPAHGSRSAAVLAPPAIELLVVGAHMSGGPLNHELTGRGARLIGCVRTASSYRLYRLPMTPHKPGLVRAEVPSPGAVGIEGELWALPPSGLLSLLAELPSQMALGPVTLEDGSRVVGFLCEPASLDKAHDITAYGGWHAYLEATT